MISELTDNEVALCAAYDALTVRTSLLLMTATETLRRSTRCCGLGHVCRADGEQHSIVCVYRQLASNLGMQSVKFELITDDMVDNGSRQVMQLKGLARWALDNIINGFAHWRTREERLAMTLEHVHEQRASR